MAFDVLSFVMGQQTAKSGGGSDIELIENMPFVVDFSEGDQFIEAPEGYAVKSAVVKKPENLVAENIAEGVDIAGIVGTLASGGGSGGGSSLEPGDYMKILPSPANDGVCTFIKYQGKEYIFVTAKDLIYVYDIDDVNFANPKTLSVTGMYSTSLCWAEYKGKLHFSMIAETKHWVYDGNTVTALNSIGSMADDLFVLNDILYNYSSGVLKVWDEATDTWSETPMFEGGKQYLNPDIMFIRNGELYFVYSGKEYYKLVNNVLVQEGIFEQSLYKNKNICFDDNWNMYCISNGGLLPVYYYDFETKTTTEVGKVGMSKIKTLDFRNNRLHIFGGFNSSNYADHCALYVVE